MSVPLIDLSKWDWRLCEECGAPLQGFRKQARFCSGACRAEASRRRRSVEEEKPHRTAQDNSRRPSRDGKGVHIYVTLADFLDDERLAEKLKAAELRLFTAIEEVNR